MRWSFLFLYGFTCFINYLCGVGYGLAQNTILGNGEPEAFKWAAILITVSIVVIMELFFTIHDVFTEKTIDEYVTNFYCDVCDEIHEPMRN